MPQIYFTKQDISLKIEALRDAREVLDSEIEILQISFNALDLAPEGAVCDKRGKVLGTKPKETTHGIQKAQAENRAELRKKMWKQFGVEINGGT